MFDIGFSEILLIFGLALIVLGPEKLPRVASQVGRWIGRARGMARQFREQLEEEVNLEEARKSRPPAITQSSPAGTPPPAVAAPAPAAIEPPAAPVASTGHDVAPPTEAVAQPELPATTVDTAASVASEAIQPSAQPEPPPQYPDWYSHAHPTDSEGRPLPSPSPAGTPTNDPPATESGQHDWIGGSAGDAVPAGDGGVTPTDKPAQGTTAAGYAPPHERGT
ncbi:MAG TPA: Sec-independent protein translocase protein TatB [Steroidobacteraceae bacterium]